MTELLTPTLEARAQAEVQAIRTTPGIYFQSCAGLTKDEASALNARIDELMGNTPTNRSPESMDDDDPC